MDSYSVQQQVVSKVRQLVEKANMKFGISMAVPAVTFDLKGTTAGKAHIREHLVNFNLALLTNNIDDFLENTVGHEVAHLVTYKLHPSRVIRIGLKRMRTIKPHGIEWQMVMRELGMIPSRCHSYDTTEVKQQRTKYEYKCKCHRPLMVGAKIHNNIQSGLKNYHCKTCKADIVYAGTRSPEHSVVRENTSIPRTGSKKEQAEQIYLEVKGVRSVAIQRYINELNMSPAGASTYFQNAKKKFQ